MVPLADQLRAEERIDVPDLQGTVGLDSTWSRYPFLEYGPAYHRVLMLTSHAKLSRETEPVHGHGLANISEKGIMQSRRAIANPTPFASSLSQ